MKTKLFLLQLIVFGFFPTQVFSQNFESPQSLVDKLKRSIEQPSQGQLEIVAIKSTPMPQIYEVELNSGNYFIAMFRVTIYLLEICIRLRIPVY